MALQAMFASFAAVFNVLHIFKTCWAAFISVFATIVNKLNAVNVARKLQDSWNAITSVCAFWNHTRIMHGLTKCWNVVLSAGAVFQYIRIDRLLNLLKSMAVATVSGAYKAVLLLAHNLRRVLYSPSGILQVFSFAHAVAGKLLHKTLGMLHVADFAYSTLPSMVGVSDVLLAWAIPAVVFGVLAWLFGPAVLTITLKVTMHLLHISLGAVVRIGCILAKAPACIACVVSKTATLCGHPVAKLLAAVVRWLVRAATHVQHGVANAAHNSGSLLRASGLFIGTLLRKAMKLVGLLVRLVLIPFKIPLAIVKVCLKTAYRWLCILWWQIRHVELFQHPLEQQQGQQAQQQSSYDLTGSTMANELFQDQQTKQHQQHRQPGQQVVQQPTGKLVTSDSVAEPQVKRICLNASAANASNTLARHDPAVLCVQHPLEVAEHSEGLPLNSTTLQQLPVQDWESAFLKWQTAQQQ